ncbi:hypothetical protein AC249_AIPGENE26954 [Exaiptasia diaphana]|nr:hypothetical protein AC249_AIPGENE26954 [Exaiptasia diaphana]
MVKPTPDALRWRIVMLRRRGMMHQSIADTLCVSERHVRKVNKLYENTLEVKDPPRRKSKERLLSAAELLILRRIVDQNPELFLDGIQQWFEHSTGTRLHISTIDRYLNKMGITWKKAPLGMNCPSSL